MRRIPHDVGSAAARRTGLAGALGLLLLLAACVASAPAPAPAGPGPLFPCEVKAVGLPHAVFVRDPVLDMEESGLPRFEIAVDNESIMKIEIRYLVEWFDRQGMSVPSTMSRWTPVVVPSHQGHRIFGIGPSPKAYRAKVSILLTQ
jgi:uncharacterized protein YcfL